MFDNNGMEIDYGTIIGTDGIRGVANAGLDAALAYKVGQAAAIVLAKGKVTRPCIAIGKDTRISSDMLEAALIAGICASGADVLPLGVVPTPAVAYITQIAGADAGVVISASHNPFPYNGIKIFNAGGFKLSDELELEIEQLVMGDQPLPLQRDGQLGRVIKGGKKYVAGLYRSAGRHAMRDADGACRCRLRQRRRFADGGRPVCPSPGRSGVDQLQSERHQHQRWLWVDGYTCTERDSSPSWLRHGHCL